LRCPSCAKDNLDDAQFCDQCGADFAPVCPACSAENQVGARFCRKCRAKLEGEPDETPAPAKAEPRQPASELPVSFGGGRYEVKRFLGEGGRKRVFLARDARLDRDVAVAIIKTEGLDEDGLKRVRREAQAMARLGDHPHIVTIHDIGEENGQPYIVSQYMAGGELTDRLKEAENRRLSLNEALRISNEVRLALEHAHSKGIIHRDLKPANIWLTQDGTAKLGDFGLAVALDRSRLTLEGTMVGTVAYMPPEQALGRQSDARSDLYSLGCVLYEMLTGRPPFLGDDNVAIISQHINTPPVAPSWHNPEIPKALESLILRCLAKNPDERPESAASIPDVLSAIAETAVQVAAGRTSEQAAVNPLDRLAGGVFVGRETEMDELRAGLEDSLSGRGRLLMLVGEPGIGKTRTSEELATYASLRNAKVLWGKCYEGEGAPAYWPWVQLVRSYVFDRDPKELMSEMGPGAADIADVVPEVRERLPGLPPPPQLEAEQARFRLFDSITTFLKNASIRQPHVLLLDDLHWADKPSLLLLQFLARNLRGSRLLVLGTYRDVELRRAHPLSQTLAELTREGLSQRILLRGLTERDVSRFIEITAGIQPPQTLVEAVYRETEGNPFFVNEIVRLLVTDGRLERADTVTSWSVTIPQGVREVVGRRLDHLSEECNQVLTMGSVIGRDFGIRTLAKAMDRSEDAVLETLEEAVAARVISELPNRAEYYTFTHALIKETLYEELSTARRVRAHRRVGEVLEEQHRDDIEPQLAALAYHFAEAAQGGDVDKAINYATRAAELAMSQLAYEEAAIHYERALQVNELNEPPDEAQRAELLVGQADALRMGGSPNDAIDAGRKAVDAARAAASAPLLARAALVLEDARFFSAQSAELIGTVPILEEALRALGTENPVLRASLLSVLPRATYFTTSMEDRLKIAREALELAEAAGDITARVGALNGMHWALWGPERVEERLEVANEIARLAEEAGDKGLAVSGYIWGITNLLELGEIKAVDEKIKSFEMLAEELRQPDLHHTLAMWRTMRALLDGRLEEGERLALETLTIGQRVQFQPAQQFFGAHMYDLRWKQGRLGEIEGAVKAFAEGNPQTPIWRAALALVYAETGKEAEAGAELERLAVDNFAAIGRDANWLISIALLANACAPLRDERNAGTLYELLLPYSGRCLVVGIGLTCLGSASLYLGSLAALLRRWDEAERHFEDALTMNTDMGARPWVALTQQWYADMLARREGPGDREKALRLLTDALDSAQEMGMQMMVERCLALKLELQGVSSTNTGASIDAVASLVYAEKPDLRKQVAPDGTVTILFSDIQGSTAKTEQLGDTKWMEVLREHNAVVREQLKAHGGFEVKSEGDGFMLAFQSARKALQCAIETQRAFAVRNESAEEPVLVRMGLHTGEVIKEGDDFFGKHVNLAARIAGQAQGGEILVSSLLKELTASGGDIAFGDGREVALKGLSGEHVVYAVNWV
jgi:class 3 adenylate cyclase